MRSGWRSPYAPAPGCTHGELVELENEDDGHELVHIRWWACRACGTDMNCHHRRGVVLRFRDGRVVVNTFGPAYIEDRMIDLQRGISLRELKRLWLARGGEVLPVRRTGEIRFFDPRSGKRSGMANDRRKDAPLKLVMFVRKILEGEQSA